jgi:putative endonuclease
MRTMSKIGYVYMMTDKQGKLFVWATGDLKKRVWLHKHALYSLTRKKRQLAHLVYVERYGSIVDALVRKTKLTIEKRTKKLALIAEQNPSWRDLSVERQ